MNEQSKEYQARTRQLWEAFIRNEEVDYSDVRPFILESWKRSRDAGVDPSNLSDSMSMPDADIPAWIDGNMALIEVAQPHMKKLYQMVEGSGFYIQLSDKNGYLLHNIGDADIMAYGNSMTNVYTGAAINESVVGTSGIGTCVALQEPIQIWGEEHYILPHKQFVCTAAPIFDENDTFIGTLSASGKPESVHAHTLGMICSAADSIQKELRLRSSYESLKAISNQRNLILQAMTSGQLLLNDGGRIIQVNDTAMKMLDFDIQSLIGQNLIDLISFHQNHDREKDLEFISYDHVVDDMQIFRQNDPEWSHRFQVRIKTLRDTGSGDNWTLISLVESQIINKIVENIGGYQSKYTFDSIIGTSSVMQKTKEAALKAADSDLNVLILGANGTGKELFAHSIHHASEFSNGPFVAVNCAAIPRELVESELFGYERGAFTGADKNGAPGKFELADGGTIFLDEIGDMPLTVQSSVLRAIETREITRIGGRQPKPLNLRIVAATNKDLKQAVADNRFREDLYYRLAVIELSIPSLVDRREDIRPLAQHFLSQSNRGSRMKISDEAFRIMERYSWPGNIRQLVNAIERAISIADGDMIEPRHLPQEILDPDTTSTPNVLHQDDPGPIHTVRHHKRPSRQQLLDLLEDCGGNISLACERIGMSRSTFYRHLKKHDIDYTGCRGVV